MRLVFGVLAACAVLILSGYALTTTPLLGSTTLILVGTFVGLSVFALLDDKFRIDSDDAGLWLLIFLVFFTLLSGIADRSASTWTSISMVLFFAASYLFSRIVSFGTFISWYVRAMAAISLTAIGAHVLFVWAGLRFPGEIVTNRNGTHFYNGVVVFLIAMFDGSASPRAVGPFWEPGLFASFLIIALILEILFRRASPRPAILALLTFGVLITGSTAGYLLLVPVALLYWGRKRTSAYPVLAMFTIAGVVLGFVFMDDIVRTLVSWNPIMFGKLHVDELLSSARLSSFKLNLSLFSDSPFVGLGVSGAGNAYLARMGQWGNPPQTSTSTFYLAALGLPGIAYTLAWVGAIIANRDLYRYDRAVFLTCMLVILNKEPHTANFLSLTLLFFLIRDARDSRQGPRGG